MKSTILVLGILAIIPFTAMAQGNQKEALMSKLYQDVSQIELFTIQVGSGNLEPFCGKNGEHLGNCCYQLGQAVGQVTYLLSNTQMNGGTRFELIGDAGISARAEEMRVVPYRVSQYCNGEKDPVLNRVANLNELATVVKQLHDGANWIKLELDKKANK